MDKTTRDRILALLKGARDLADGAEAAGRDLNDDERATITKNLADAAALRKTSDDRDALRKQLTDLTDGIGVNPDDDPDDDGGAARQPAGYARSKRGNLGAQFTSSAEFTALMKSAPNGRFGEQTRVQSAPFGVKSLLTGADTDASAGAIVQPDYRGLLDPFYQRPLTVRSLVAAGQTTSDVIEFVRVLTMTNNAGSVAEATSTAVIGSGNPAVTDVAAGLKPESGMTFEKDSTTVKTIAHWIPSTRRALSDAAQIRTLIDTFLLYGLEEELEDQMITGSGTGEDLLGLNSTPGIQTQAAPGAGEDVFTITRRARRKVRIGGRARPSAFVFNPIDWESIELMRDGDGRFFGAGPFAMTPLGLWGLPVVESEAVAPGTAWCADWRNAVLYDREQANIQVTDSHQDFFVRNIIVILAEMRAAFAVLRPAAFVKITL